MDSPPPSPPNPGVVGGRFASLPPVVVRVAAGVGAGVFVALAAAVPNLNPDAGAFGSAVAALSVACVAVTLAPPAALPWVQLAGLASVWLCVRMARWIEPGTSWVLFGAPLAAVALAWALPAHRRRVRLAAILAVTAALPLLMYTPWQWPYAEIVIGAALQFLVLQEAMRGGRKPARDVIRYLFTGNAAVSTPVPVDDVLAEDRSPQALLRGSLWVALGFLLLAAQGEVRRLDAFEPWQMAAAGHPLTALLYGLGYWGQRFARIAGVLMLDVGALRMLGVPARPPFDAPWKSKDFLDYWKRANVYRYKMLQEVYFRNFFPTTGRWMPVGVFVMFLVSALHHAGNATWPVFTFVRWGLDGAVSALTAAWKQQRSRAGVRAFVAGKRKKPHPRWLQGVGVGVAAFVVLSLHGFLMDLSRPDRALVELLWTVFPRRWLGG